MITVIMMTTTLIIIMMMMIILRIIKANYGFYLLAFEFLYDQVISSFIWKVFSIVSTKINEGGKYKKVIFPGLLHYGNRQYASGSDSVITQYA